MKMTSSGPHNAARSPQTISAITRGGGGHPSSPKSVRQIRRRCVATGRGTDLQVIMGLLKSYDGAATAAGSPTESYSTM
jgi:hypothetical protein